MPVRVYQKSGNTYNFLFCINPHYTQLLEYRRIRKLRFNILKYIKEENQRKKDEKVRLRLLWNMCGYKFNWDTNQITRMTGDERDEFHRSSKRFSPRLKGILDSISLMEISTNMPDESP
jgi:hypothetical protein